MKIAGLREFPEEMKAAPPQIKEGPRKTWIVGRVYLEDVSRLARWKGKVLHRQ